MIPIAIIAFRLLGPSKPAITIANRDGSVVLRLLKEAVSVCRSARVGDYAESIARQTLKLLALENVAMPTERFEEIANLSIPMLHDAVEEPRAGRIRHGYLPSNAGARLPSEERPS